MAGKITVTALAAAALVGVLCLGSAQAQGPQTKAPRATAWFGVPTPGPVSDLDKPTFAQDPHITGPHPALFARVKDPSGALSGSKMMGTVRTVTGFSRESRAAGDILWGRVSGRP